MAHSQKILTGLRQTLGGELISESRLESNTFVLLINRERVREAARYLIKEAEGRLIHVSSIDRGVDGYEVVYHYAFDHVERFLHLNVKVALSNDMLEVESVAVEAPECSWSEREMMEFTPVKFTSHPDPRHLWLPYEWPHPVESSQCENYAEDKAQEKVGMRVQREIDASSVPLGPYHPLLMEGAYFRVKVKGEEITDVDVKLGWNHRGIMKLFEERSYSRGVFLAERICGICNVAHTTAYLNAIESLSCLEIPTRARYIRTLMAELERIHSHLLWLGVAGDLVGFKTLFMLSWKAREEVLEIFESLTGSRRAPAMNLIGGVRRDVSGESTGKTARRLDQIAKKVDMLIDVIYNHPVARRRLQEVGRLPLATAKDLGAVGPTARASGWKIDVRWSSPYAAYSPEYTTWDIMTDTGGDAWSRTIVRLKEILVSIDIAMQCLERLQHEGGSILAEPSDPKEFKYAEALGKAEAPRGELMYYVITDGSSPPHSGR
ncbi:MAG: NADH-quinone oxidoreductase subunit C, partial [Candidatus Bathyarchaeia archaeon]